MGCYVVAHLSFAQRTITGTVKDGKGEAQELNKACKVLTIGTTLAVMRTLLI